MRYVAEGCRPSLLLELGHWIEATPRFADFVTANRDKIRKKLRSSPAEEARLDVRAELLVARLIVADRRFELAFEAYGSRQPGPDLTVTYRANQRFNLEVTRLRAATEADPPRLANVIATKVRQLPSDIPNALVIVANAPHTGGDELNTATRLLKARTDSRDDAFFAGRGLKDARDFYAHYLRLGGVLLLDEATPPMLDEATPPMLDEATPPRPDEATPSTRIVFAVNREARRALPSEALAALVLPRHTPLPDGRNG